MLDLVDSLVVRVGVHFQLVVDCLLHGVTLLIQCIHRWFMGNRLLLLQCAKPASVHMQSFSLANAVYFPEIFGVQLNPCSPSPMLSPTLMITSYAKIRLDRRKMRAISFLLVIVLIFGTLISVANSPWLNIK